MNPRVLELERNGTIDFTRQRDWFDPTSIDAKLTVIGGGGIGSLFTVMAGKLGIGRITVFDDDSVEAHNLPNQFFPLDKLGYPKVHALSEAVSSFTISEVEEKNERVTDSTQLMGLVVSGVDSMAARTEIAKAVKANRFHIPRYWDARIGGEKIVIYSVNPKDPEEWRLFEKTLYSDEDAQEDPCTRRSVIDVMGHVGSHLLTGVRKQLAGDKVPGMIYMNVEANNIIQCELSEAGLE
jgi:adenylyltransferase/sulfurtransferase